jgi:spore germination cell wall hydrolase CwlJ-like protein
MKLFVILFLISLKAFGDTDTDCLVKTLYGESRGEGMIGSLIVAKVILNRAKLSDSSVCEVVQKDSQFDGYQKYKNKFVPIEFYITVEKWMLFIDAVPKQFRYATHFHSVKRKPRWTKGFAYLGRWKGHIFYG